MVLQGTSDRTRNRVQPIYVVRMLRNLSITHASRYSWACSFGLEGVVPNAEVAATGLPGRNHRVEVKNRKHPAMDRAMEDWSIN